MTWAVMIFMLICGAVFQLLIPPIALLGQAKLPFLLAIVFYYSLSYETPHMLVAAFLAGLLQDSLSPIPLGYSSFCFVAAGWIASRFRNMVMTESLLPPMLFGAVGNGVLTLFLCILLVKDGLVVCRPGWFALKVLGSLIIGMICTPIVFVVVGKVDRMLGNIIVKQETAVIDAE
jgi:rod shape-determining protein MreD